MEIGPHLADLLKTILGAIVGTFLLTLFMFGFYKLVTKGYFDD